jgi:hypothetical protein
MLLRDYKDIKESLEMILQDEVAPVQAGRIIGKLEDAVLNNMDIVEGCLCLSCEWAGEYCAYWNDYCQYQEKETCNDSCQYIRLQCSDYTKEKE